MQKPWRPCDCDFEAVELSALPPRVADYLRSYTIEFVSIGFVPIGDYRLHSGRQVQATRYFQSADGAVLGWVCDNEGRRAFELGSVLSDGTYVQSTPHEPAAPWNCCRFPVHVNFGPGCGLDELLVMHLTSLVELEHGCGATLRYDRSRLQDIVYYSRMLMHETLHPRGAPAEPLPVPQSEPVRVLAVS